jgi:hypothetical protein
LYTRQTHLPAQMLQTIPITWPFADWHLDMVGPLRQALRGFTHLLVAVDKFSKWIEARPIVNVRSEEVVSFFTDIIYCFGIPNTTINGTQLLMDQRRIHLRCASVRTYTFFTTGFPRFLSIRGARGLQAFDLPRLTNLSKPYLWLN